MPRPRSVLLLISILLLLLIFHSSAMASDLPIEQSTDKPFLTPLPCTIILDDKTQTIPSICVNQIGQSMVSLKDAAQLFSCNYVFQANGTLQVSYSDIAQTFLPLEYISTAPLDSLTPLEQSEVVYLPLRRLAQGFSYVVMYKSQGPLIILQSANYQEIIPTPPENLPNWGALGPELGIRWRYKTMIGSFYTTLINSSEGRTNNIILACEKINGTILNSGEVFSYNKTVGQRTSQAGYKSAPIFSGNKVINGIGGGICQASSTLYNATLASGMQVIERHPHSLPVKYCPPQLDATVSWGCEDYKFKNTLDRPVQILCCVYGPYVLMAIVEVD
ncbi:MAG: VanW-like domain containing protein [Firmicutes bacterium]|nr:VanW-like domain containing protein [Bacillota bacterium]